MTFFSVIFFIPERLQKLQHGFLRGVLGISFGQAKMPGKVGYNRLEMVTEFVPGLLIVGCF
jgi:hypothetical protein